MTKDQIDTWRAILFNTHPGNEWRELCDLAERALVLEDVLAAAKEYVTAGETKSDTAEAAHANTMRRVGLWKQLRAAIDRAEGKS